MTNRTEAKAQSFDVRPAGFMGRAVRRRSMGAPVMPAAVSVSVYWPVGIALASWLFFEIARRM